MTNELLLIASIVILYGSVLLFYYVFDEVGLYCWTVLATIAANIEVLILIDAFGMEQTLGNILFASTFLVTDILSEIAGRKAATKAVQLGIATSMMFILISQSWLMYLPNQNDWAFSSMQAIFSNTPRLMLVGLVVYGISQWIDVQLYHLWWRLTTNYFGSTYRFLWLRNNGSTLISQLINAIAFTFGAFWGVYDVTTLWHITGSSYIIFIFTSLADTPAVYLARYLQKRKIAQINH